MEDKIMYKKISNYKLLAIIALFILTLAGCMGALQRGMMGETYISTARPAISLSVNNMPLMTAGRGMTNLFWSGMAGGLTIDVWLAVYGTGGLAPMAIVAQAQTPQGWYWDGIMRRPFSVDDSVEVFNGVSYQACTFIVDPANDPFGELVTGVQPDGQPQLWLTRAYAARYNFNDDKIILEYREPLPQGVTTLTALPLGQGNLLLEFAERARNAFVVGPAPANPQGVVQNYAQGIQWQFMGQNFLGTVSQNAVFNRD